MMFCVDSVLYSMCFVQCWAISPFGLGLAMDLASAVCVTASTVVATQKLSRQLSPLKKQPCVA